MMTTALPDTAEQDLLNNVLLLDDWVSIYRLCIAADAMGTAEGRDLAVELDKHGLINLCTDLAERIVAQQFGLDPGTQLHEATDHTFNITCHLQRGLNRALT